MGRECHPLAADECNTHSTHGAAERQTGELRGCGCAVDGDHVVQLCGIQSKNRDDHLNLVAQSLDETGTQRAVDQPAGEDGVLTGTPFATEERTGDPTHGVHALFDVHRQREEVELILGLLARSCGAEQQCVVVEADGD